MLSAAGKALSGTFRGNPIFVVGAGRSGTTVVKDALGTHPQILNCDGEAPFLRVIGATMHDLQAEPNAAYRMETLRTGAEYAKNALRRMCFEGATGRHWGLRRVMREAAKGRKSPFRIKRWCAKTFPATDDADGLTALYPSARFIYVMRNGCDVLRSRTQFSPMRDRSFEDHCREWADLARRYAYLLDRNDATTVRHETLIASPDSVFATLLGFLDVDPDRRPADFAKTTLVHPLDAPTEVDVPVGRVLSDRGPAHEEWTTSERETFKSLCADAMHQLGYEMPF